MAASRSPAPSPTLTPLLLSPQLPPRPYPSRHRRSSFLPSHPRLRSPSVLPSYSRRRSSLLSSNPRRHLPSLLPSYKKRRETKNHRNKVEEDSRIPNDWSFKVQEFKVLQELELKKEVGLCYKE